MLITDHAVSILVLALILDRIIGDPDWLWSAAKHPVALFGDVIGTLDRQLNRDGLPDTRRRWNGFVAIGGLAGTAAALGLVLALLFGSFGYGWIPETLLVAVLLAQKSLLDHVRGVILPLRQNDLAGARKSLAMIVGRNVEGLAGPDISRAAIETTAENFSDGTIAPAFWYLFLGLPGLLVYKLVNTADSMIGHKNETYLQFGYASARLDDVLNFIPARISAALITLVAPLQGGSILHATEIVSRDASAHLSPNAGWPEAAMAGAIDVALGGPRAYGKQTVDAAWLNGGGEHELAHIHIQSATALIESAWFLVLIVLAATQVFEFI
jgi:adenosylcobinamide-phosphate synthase